MPNRTPSTRFQGGAALSVLVALVALVATATASPAEETAAPASPPVATPTPPSSVSSPGMKVNIDPATGRFLDEPAADGAAQKRAAEPAPIVMEPSPVPGGGVGFRVSDQRYVSEIHATTHPDGTPDIGCDAPAR